MTQIAEEDVPAASRVTCKECKTFIGLTSDSLSKNFVAQHGPAQLFEKVSNCTAGEPTERPMTTGMHTIAEISCNGCKSYLGWIYIHAEEEIEKYKEGKTILEMELVDQA